MIKPVIHKLVKEMKMKKLEEIPKKEVFKVPDGYFENLPGIIQARVAQQNKSEEVRPVFAYALQYALPIIAFFALGLFWFIGKNETPTAESILASIQTEDLVAYLDEADITTEELLDDVSLSDEDATEIEGAVYEFELDDTNVEDFLDDMDINSLQR